MKRKTMSPSRWKHYRLWYCPKIDKRERVVNEILNGNCSELCSVWESKADGIDCMCSDCTYINIGSCPGGKLKAIQYAIVIE